MNRPTFALADGNGRGRKKELKIKKELQPSVKAFAMVYYWIGNMMPVGSSFSPGCNKTIPNDTWEFKLQEILDCFTLKEEEWEKSNKTDILATIPNQKEKQKTRWPAWISLCWKSRDIKQFITDNYLQDLFKIADDQIRIKNNVNNEELEKENGYINWFLNNTKIIIQRSYRIIFDFKDDWVNSPVDKANVEKIITYIYKKTGVPNSIDISLF